MTESFRLAPPKTLSQKFRVAIGYLEASQTPCGWLGMRRWKEEASVSPDAQASPEQSKGKPRRACPLARRHFFETSAAHRATRLAIGSSRRGHKKR
jgi:hypothetical protein